MMDDGLWMMDVQGIRPSVINHPSSIIHRANRGEYAKRSETKTAENPHPQAQEIAPTAAA
ncbi:MAG: hypothetical protein HYY15_02260 [Candidatus Omnitrophica bacterium]|nr:hypothetical protein [Candidatus Omnitrophota bacterium]